MIIDRRISVRILILFTVYYSFIKFCYYVLFHLMFRVKLEIFGDYWFRSERKQEAGEVTSKLVFISLTNGTDRF